MTVRRLACGHRESPLIFHASPERSLAQLAIAVQAGQIFIQETCRPCCSRDPLDIVRANVFLTRAPGQRRESVVVAVKRGPRQNPPLVSCPSAIAIDGDSDVEPLVAKCEWPQDFDAVFVGPYPQVRFVDLTGWQWCGRGTWRGCRAWCGRGRTGRCWGRYRRRGGSLCGCRMWCRGRRPSRHRGGYRCRDGRGTGCECDNGDCNKDGRNNKLQRQFEDSVIHNRHLLTDLLAETPFGPTHV